MSETLPQVIKSGKKHNYQLVTSPQNPQGTTNEKEENLPFSRCDEHPVHIINNIFGRVRFEISPHKELDERLILFHRAIKGDCIGVSFLPMGVGIIINHLGSMANIIPPHGQIDIPLLSPLIRAHAKEMNWIGLDYGVARAFCGAQKNIPTMPHFDRLQFLFPGTIVFDHEEGICIPMVKKIGEKWFITHRNIFSTIIPGVDLWAIS